MHDDRERRRVDYGKANGYDLILDATAALYFSDAPDITDKIIAEADKAYQKGQ